MTSSMQVLGAGEDVTAQSTGGVSSPVCLYTCNYCLSGSSLYSTHTDTLPP